MLCLSVTLSEWNSIIFLIELLKKNDWTSQTVCFPNLRPNRDEKKSNLIEEKWGKQIRLFYFLCFFFTENRKPKTTYCQCQSGLLLLLRLFLSLFLSLFWEPPNKKWISSRHWKTWYIILPVNKSIACSFLASLL